MTKSLVSVVIPMFNAAPWVGAALDSVRAQTWPRVQIIVVDDGSHDDSVAIAARHAGPHAVLLRQENAGAAAARNAGLGAADGDYVQYLDADDLLDPEKIAVQVDRLARSPAGCVASGAWGRFRSDPADATFVAEPVWRDMSSAEWLVTSWSGGGMMHPAGWLVPRGVIERAGPWNPTLSLNDDGEYFGRVVMASAGVLFCPEARSYYRSGVAGSLSGRTSEAARESQYRTLVTLGEALLALENSERVRRAFAAQLQRFVYETYPDQQALVTRAEARLAELGDPGIPPPSGGAAFRIVTRLAGWKAAARLRRLAR